MIKELYLTFENLDSALSDLLSLVNEKKNALVKRDAELLNEVNKKEEVLINRINKIERSRIQMVKDYLQLEEKLSQDKMEKFYDHLNQSIPEEIMNSLNILRNNIKEKTRKVREINQQNIALINSSREFIKMLFQSMQGEKRSLVVNRKV